MYQKVLSSEDWEKMRRGVARIVEVAAHGTLIVAEVENEIAGVVAYLPPGSPRPDIFEPEWSVIRMLSVSPRYRGLGIGTKLSKECIRRAREDEAQRIALHTGEMMVAAKSIYDKLGFKVVREIEPRFGFRYRIYAREP